MSGGGKAREAYGKAGGGGVETGEVDSEDTGLVELLRAHQAVIVSVQGTWNESSSQARKPANPRARKPARSHPHEHVDMAEHKEPRASLEHLDVLYISTYMDSKGREMYLEST